MGGIPQPGLCRMPGFYLMVNVPYMGPSMTPGYSYAAGNVQSAKSGTPERNPRQEKRELLAAAAETRAAAADD